ncbi:MAG: hypothetical protein WBG58_20310 [Ignavibacteriaceae bacterium]
MKNNLTFYSHYVDAHNHWKFKLLRSLLGWEAEGRFWALNNMIAATDECILKINKKNIRACVISDLSMDEESFTNFLNVLSHDCELLINLDGNITTGLVRDSLKLVMKERESARIRKEKLLNRSNNETKGANIFGIR